ncbi:lantibiotic immunity ABC transporter MutG family permease subunit [Haloimpatiens sp. FM7330]|uniref:lantibiotic immunity ABC transporter MutG family permease subunit n=1 Tax=Haloimpatiens sp. FM7330 TaxID=3298610 RepID=UPI003625D635
MDLIRSIKADFCKLRHTSVLWIHILIPLIGAGVFLGYYSFSPWSAISKIKGYFEVLALVFPLLIGVICSMVISQEEQAGNFQEILTGTTWRGTTFLSKLILLIFGAIFSISIALIVFVVGFHYILDQGNFSISIYVHEAFALLLGNIFLYILHIYLSLRFGKGASIGLGIVGVTISALMLTGLGDEIWKITPWAWGCRLSDYAILNQIDPSIYNMLQGEIHQGIINAIVATIIALILSLFWFSRWEGRKSYE